MKKKLILKESELVDLIKSTISEANIINEQTLSPCIEISATVCYEGNIGQPSGTPVQFPCSLVDNGYATQSLVGAKVQDMGAGYGQGTYEITSVSANQNYTGPTPSNPHLTVHGAEKYPCGAGGSQDHCVNCQQSIMIPIPAGTPCPQGSILLQGTSPNFIAPCYECDGNGNCNGPGWFNGGPTVFNSQQECQTGIPGQPACSPPNNDHDCINGQCVATPGGGQYSSLGACQAVCGVGPNCAQLIPNFMTTCDQKEALALAGGNGCNWICNKVNSLTNQQPFPNTTQGIRKQCKLDYVQAAANNVPCTNSNTGNCTSGSGGGCGVDTAWVQTRLNHHTTNGCFGNPANWSVTNPQPASFCGRKDNFCNANPMTPNKQLRCDWLSGTYTPPPNCPSVPGPPSCGC